MSREEPTLENPDEIKEPDKEHYFNQPKLGKGGPSKLRQQFSRGMTYFLVIAASLLFYFALFAPYEPVRSISEGFRSVKTGCLRLCCRISAESDREAGGQISGSCFKAEA